jgi:cell division transport system ATP-binding protein
MVGLKGKEDSFPGQLSGGEQQRVGVARAIVNRPLLLIADEPSGNLDMDTAREIMELLYDINRKGTTVVMATHAWDLVRQSGKRVITLEAGRIAADTNAQENWS